MTFLGHVLFESPLWLGLISFLLFAGVLFTRLRWESTAARRYALPVTLSFVAILFVVQKLVTTQREEVQQAIGAFLAAIEGENLSACADLMSDTFQSDTLDRNRFLAYIESFLDTWDIRDVRVQRRDVSIVGDEAELILAATATASQRMAVGQRHWGVWRIGWRREGDRWKIISIHPKMIDGRPATTLGEFRNFSP